jgi:thiamine kinase-like enzyme
MAQHYAWACAGGRVAPMEGSKSIPRGLKEICKELGVKGEPTPLEGGITNHNFKAKLKDGRSVVLRVGGKNTDQLGIDRGAERIAGEAAASLGVGPEVVAYFEARSCLVTGFVEGKQVTAKMLRTPEVLEPVAQALRRFHDSETLLPTRFNVPTLAREYARRANAMDRVEVKQAIKAADAIATVVEDDEVPCHNDLLAGNFIRTESGAHDLGVKILDWEYAGIGSRYFDLGNLSINNDFSEDDDLALLTAYGLEGDKHFARLRLMRAMSDVREAMWGVIQQVVSEIEFDFATYSREHFERLSKTFADPRIKQWMRDAASP